VVVGTESEENLRAYLDGYNLVVDKLLTVSPQMVLVNGTPTLVAVNRVGNVADAWLGLLDAVRQRQLEATLFGPALGGRSDRDVGMSGGPSRRNRRVMRPCATRRGIVERFLNEVLSLLS
jgi:hypothetical protein